MKKFLAFFVVLFGVCGETWAWEVNEQDGLTPECVDYEYVEGTSDKLQQFIVYFDHDSPVSGCDFSGLTNYLNSVQKDLQGVIVIGAADRTRRDGVSDNNAILSKNRAQWVINNVLPASLRQQCSFNGMQNAICSTYAMGDANDFANSDGARDHNADERSVRVHLVWRLAKCQASFIESLAKYKTALEQAKGKYPEHKNAIEEALKKVVSAQGVCPNAGKVLTATESESLQEVLGLMLEIQEVVPEVSEINLEYELTQTTYNTSVVDASYSNLIRARNTFELSEWRDSEGKFNTARLVSDATAGVVLGTVGGLVTAHVVKKNQLKKGFEDINCSIGGQNVAKYGDQMVVGLQ